MVMSGMMMICGNSIEELEKDLAMLKVAVQSGKTMGIGGSSVEDIENGMKVVKDYFPSVDTGKVTVCNTEEEDEEEEDIDIDYDDVVEQILEDYSVEDLLDMDEDEAHEVVNMYLEDMGYETYDEDDVDTIIDLVGQAIDDADEDEEDEEDEEYTVEDAVNVIMTDKPLAELVGMSERDSIALVREVLTNLGIDVTENAVSECYKGVCQEMAKAFMKNCKQ